MTEPRKTPRTTALDIANDDESLCETAYDKIHALARALEAETQELAEVMENMVAVLTEWHADMPDCVGDKEPDILTAALAALARHRAKQEVQK